MTNYADKIRDALHRHRLNKQIKKAQSKEIQHQAELEQELEDKRLEAERKRLISRNLEFEKRKFLFG